MTVHTCTLVRRDTGEITKMYIASSHNGLRRTIVTDEEMWKDWDDPDWVEAALYLPTIGQTQAEFEERLHDTYLVEFHVTEMGE